MKKHRDRRQKSGQVLVITALIIVLLLLSTALYVAETEKSVPISYSEADVNVLAVKLGTLHSVVSALANISNGGNSEVLAEDLSRYASLVLSHSYASTVKLDATPLDVAPYQEGVWFSWGQNGLGVSSIFVDFTLNSTGMS